MDLIDSHRDTLLSLNLNRYRDTGMIAPIPIAIALEKRGLVERVSGQVGQRGYMRVRINQDGIDLISG